MDNNEYNIEVYEEGKIIVNKKINIYKNTKTEYLTIGDIITLINIDSNILYGKQILFYSKASEMYLNYGTYDKKFNNNAIIQLLDIKSSENNIKIKLNNNNLVTLNKETNNHLEKSLYKFIIYNKLIKKNKENKKEIKSLLNISYKELSNIKKIFRKIYTGDIDTNSLLTLKKKELYNLIN